jgi:hypothetical protein
VALTPALAACGGGTTGEPVVRTAAPPPAAPATTAGTATTAEAPASARPPATATATAPAAPAPAPGTQAATTAQPTTAAPAPAPAATMTTPRSADAPADATAEPAPEPAGTLVDERAQLVLTERDSPAHYFQQGTVTGTYEGTMALEVRITSRGVLVAFTATVKGGTISGRGLAVAIIDGSPMPRLRGTAAITGGTGRFARIHGRRLTVTGRARPDGSRARVRLAGTVSY